MAKEQHPERWPFVGPAREAWARHTRLLRVVGIIAILLFSFWAGMGPHWDYKYPLHVDEWFTIGYTQSTLEEGSLEYPRPYGRGEMNYHPEMGFHLLLGFLKTITGLSWLGLYRIAPGVMIALLAFLVYALGHRDRFGWAAALFVPLIPTSLRTLGPTFLVPVSTALLFIPATLLLLHRLEARGSRQSLWILLILIGGTIFVHPPTEGIVTALAVMYLAALVAEVLVIRHYRAAANLVIAIGVRMLIPVIVLGVWLPSYSRTALEESTSADPGTVPILGFNAGFFEAFGVVAVALFVWGLFILVLNRKYGLRTYVVPAVTMFLLLFLNFVYPRYLLGPRILYERGWLYLGLFIAILAGYGVAHYFHSIPALTRKIGSLVSHRSTGWIYVLLIGLGLSVVAVALTTGLFNKQRGNYANYYHMMDDSVYADFVWLGQYTTPGHKVVMMEPSLAWAYPPIAGPGNTVRGAVAAPYTSSWVERVRKVLATGVVDTDWLRQQGVSVLYTRLPGSQRYTQLKNSELPEVRPGVYLVPP